MSAGAPEPPTDIAGARADLPLCAPDRPVYMNIGGAGPMPRPAADAVRAAMDRALGEGRGSLAAVERSDSVAGRVRAEAAGLVGGAPEEIALTGNTTVGVNIALWGTAWTAGDEIVTTALEHPGVSVPVGVVARRFGLRVHHIGADEAAGDLERAVARRSGPRTRLVVLSHVAYGTGGVLDIAGAARAARAGGALCVVDGAQSVGAIPVDARALGAHVYAFPAHKWLYGPEGLGAAWIDREALERMDLSFAGYESGTGHTPEGGLSPHPDARRHEVSTPATPLLDGWLAALEWLAGIGWPRIFDRTARGQEAAAAALAAVPGVRVLTPADRHAGLVTFQAPGPPPPLAAARMVRQGVIVRWLEHPPALRASVGFHWCDEDVARLAAAVRAVSGC